MSPPSVQSSIKKNLNTQWKAKSRKRDIFKKPMNERTINLFCTCILILAKKLISLFRIQKILDTKL